MADRGDVTPIDYETEVPADESESALGKDRAAGAAQLICGTLYSVLGPNATWAENGEMVNDTATVQLNQDRGDFGALTARMAALASQVP